MLTREFLSAVITAPAGYFCLALSNGSGGFLECWHKWPDDIDKIVSRADKEKDNANVYFSSYLFKAPRSIKENVLPTRTIQADLDEASTANLPLEPTVLVETSPGRHQAFWRLDREVPLEEHELLSKKLTYSIEKCDRSGWPLGRKVRIPNTLNHKYLDGPKQVTVISFTNKAHGPEQFEALPEVPVFVSAHFDDAATAALATGGGGDRLEAEELLEQVKGALPVTVWAQYAVTQADRSAALWALMLWSFKGGLSRAQVFTLAKHSANNKYLDLKARGDEALAKDVLRAEFHANSNLRDDRAAIQDLYRKQIGGHERKQQIFALILKAMQEQGEFIHTLDGNHWYVRRDVGRPIAVTRASEHLNTLLDVQYGLNSTLEEAHYTTAGLMAYCGSLPANGNQGALAAYNQNTNTLLLHTGKKVVLQIASTAIEAITNGAHNLIFPWSDMAESFTPALGKSNTVDWGEELFGAGTRGFGSSVQNVTNMTPPQAMALLKVWLIFVLLRDAAYARPILAAFGQPGSGKSTLFRKIYLLLYGRYKSIEGLKDEEAYDIATSLYPLVLYDNVDKWEDWLPDRLAQSASVSDVTVRKLFTNVDWVTIRRQAMLGVTAHSPKFGREDVADRLLLFTFRRLETEEKGFVSETDIFVDMLAKRNLIWGAIIRDTQAVLSQPEPDRADVPQFRIEDFAKIGLRIARALNCEADFRASIQDVRGSQQNFTLEEEGLLVSSITTFVAKFQSNGSAKPYTVSQLWTMLEQCADDPRGFQNKYRNSVALSKKLLAMQPSLASILDIQQQGRIGGGPTTWLITPKKALNHD